MPEAWPGQGNSESKADQATEGGPYRPGDVPYGRARQWHSESSTFKRKLVSVQVLVCPSSFGWPNSDIQAPMCGNSVKPAGTFPHVSTLELSFGPTQISCADTRVTRAVYLGPSPSPSVQAVTPATTAVARTHSATTWVTGGHQGRPGRSQIGRPPGQEPWSNARPTAHLDGRYVGAWPTRSTSRPG